MTKGKKVKGTFSGGREEGSNAPQKFISERENERPSATSDVASSQTEDDALELQTISTRDLAELVSLSPRAVLDLAHKGTIQRIEKDTYPLLDSVRTIVRRDKERLEKMLNTADDGLRLMKANADLAELKYMQEMELYASVTELNHVQSKMIEHIKRTLLDAVPAITAKAIKVAHDEATLNECLQDEIRATLIACAGVDVDQMLTC